MTTDTSKVATIIVPPSPRLEGLMARMKAEKAERMRRAHAIGVCVRCGEEAVPKCYSDFGRWKYRKTGVCEPCDSGLFADAP